MSKRTITYFPSKILLFGEYTVTIGGNAIAVPFEKYSGSWQFDKSKNNSVFYDLIEYLNKINWKQFNAVFLYDKMADDLSNGLHFESNIKTGFGAGSSGAVCAGLFDSYFVIKEYNIENLNKILAKIESYFHGISSGIDPLVSYLNKAVMTTNNGFELYDKDILKMNDYGFYLLDSNTPRSTKKYVNIFKEKLKTNSYRNGIINPLTSYNNSIVSEFVAGNEDAVFRLFQKISKIQYHNFKEMILPELSGIWKNILQQDKLSIKLCGAGGGGYYLLMAKKKLDVKELFNKHSIVKI